MVLYYSQVQDINLGSTRFFSSLCSKSARRLVGPYPDCLIKVTEVMEVVKVIANRLLAS